MSSPKAKAAPRSVNSFRLAHVKTVHVPAKISAALEAMQKEHGSEHYEYEDEFAARAKISVLELRAMRERFKAHVVEAPTIGKKSVRYAWFATAQAAKVASKED